LERKIYEMKTSVWRCVAVLAMAVLGALAAFAQEPWEKPAFTASAQEMLQAAATVKADKPEPAAVLLMENRFVLDEAGRMNQTLRMVYRVDTPFGVGNWSDVGTIWEPWHAKQPQIRARVITPDGQEHMLDPKTLIDAPAHEDSPGTYGDTRIYHGPLPAVAVGSVVEEEIVSEETEPFFSGGRTQRVGFEFNVLRHMQRLVVEAPASLPLRYTTVLLPNVKVERQESNGRVKLAFEQRDMPGRRNIDPMLPSDVPRFAFVEFSTGKSWQAVAGRYAELVEPQVKPEQVKALVADAKKKGQSRQQLIAELVARMHREVRYTGLEFGEARLTPQPPAEVLNRKYGDCKDKATLLVTMLRAMGIPAYVALLNADNGDRDSLPDTPGMGRFNHAIVYVPGEHDLWIDATDEFVPVGELPWQDNGRMALVIRDSTTALVRISESTAAENVDLEKREFTLADYGPARVVETTEPTGAFGVTYRANYSEPDTKERREVMERYIKSAYLSDTLTALDHSDAKDMSKPFQVRLEAARAKRGYTDVQDAVAVIIPAWIASNLPEYFRQEEDKDAEKDKPARTADFELWAASAWEWQYRIVPPPGFKLRALPESKSQTMGPVRFTQEYKAGDDGVVTARLRFAVEKRRFSAEEGKALRQGMADLLKSDSVVIGFEHEGFRLISEGKGAEGLKVYRALAEQHPKLALHRARLAEAQLMLGLGESARITAREAVQLEPDSALAQKTLGHVLEFDLIGRRYKKGFDPEGSAAAYRKAIQLDPKDDTIPLMLGGVLEYNADGERYGPGAKLDEAITVIRDIKEKDKDRQVDDPLNWNLMCSRRFAELSDALAKNGNGGHVWLKLVATTGTSGTKAAIEESRRLISNEQERTEALGEASRQLMRLRMYPEAAELLTAATAGQAETGRAMPMTELLRHMKRHEDMVFPDDDPKAPMTKGLIDAMLGDATKAKQSFLLHDAIEEEELQEDLKHGKDLFPVAENGGYPLNVLLDMIVAGMVIRQEGDDATGYRLNVQMLGAENDTEYVIKNNGKYQLLWTSKGNAASIGKHVLSLLQKGDTGGARRWLDWVRDQQKLAGGDDSLAGPVFPRFWSKGQDADAQAMKLAAIALITPSKAIASYLPVLEQARLQAKSDTERTNFDLALAYGYMAVENWNAMKQAGERLLKAYPGSDIAMGLAGVAYGHMKQWSAWDAAIQERQRRTPDDTEVQRLWSRFYEEQGLMTKSREALRPVVDSGRATPMDLNQYAWDGIFTGKVTQEDVEIAQRAASSAKTYAVTHTLACIYAEVGKLNDARQMLLQAITEGSLSEPDSAIWYGLGRIAEEYGEPDAAARAYARVEKPKPFEPVAVSTFALADMRTRQMAAAKKQAGGAGK
jgi:transglutaminase-like putative cysteine protease/tetratricopeptide (TPR) repeat protein